MNRGQAALEFTLISVFMLIAFAVMIIVTEARYASIEKERFEASVQDLLDVLESEVILAYEGGAGYQRNMTLPQTLGGIAYTLGINNNQTGGGHDELWVVVRNEEYLRFLEQDVNGTFQKGHNQIRGGAPVQIN